MRRRTVLATLATGAAVGSARAHPTSTGDGAGAGASDPESDVTPLGTLALPEAREAVVAGTTVYVATLDGFAAVDASDPAAPRVLARRTDLLADRENGPLTGVQDLAVDGDRLLAVGPANGRAPLMGAVVFDVTDPAAPARVAVHETDYPVHNSDLADGVAYLTGNGAPGNPLVTVDADAGAELGRWSLVEHDDAWADVAPRLRVLHDVWVQDGRAYLAHWDAGTWILDVTDPAAPAVVSRVRGRSAADLAAVSDDDLRREYLETPGNDHFVAVDESADLLGVGAEAWDADGDRVGGPGGISLYDVSAPERPERVGELAPPATPDPSMGGVWTTAHNFRLRDGRCYAAWYQGGVTVHDVTDPGDPRRVLAWRDSDRTRFWTAVPGAGDWVAAPTMGTDDADPALFLFPDAPADRATATPVSTAPVTPSSAVPGRPSSTATAPRSSTRTAPAPGDGTPAEGSGDAASPPSGVSAVGTEAAVDGGVLAAVVALAAVAWRRWG
ncbi:MAG: hypothetical protein ABEJ89_08555 [Haloarculaceae archaeon]